MSMSSLSLREKAIIYLMLLVVIGLLAYMFGVRTLNSAYADMQVELTNLQAQKDYLDQLKQENVNTENAIEELKNNIISFEQSFISEIKSENLEQYVLKVFEQQDNPFLVSVDTENVGTNAIVMADGSVSADSLLCQRVNVRYSTTDGYEGLQADKILNPTTDEHGNLIAENIASLINETGVFNEENYYGYDQFIAALKVIEKVDPGCVKISKIQAESSYGYMTLSASIDFYGAHLTNRISSESRSNGFAVWKGETNVDTEGGFIGMPYIVRNENSMWNGVMIDASKVTGFLERPFASYVSNAVFTRMIQQRGLAAIVGQGIPTGNEANVPVTNDEQ